MSILVDKNTRVLVQGITGRDGSFHTKLMLEYGTKIVAGVTPGKGGSDYLGIPVFDTVREAVKKTSPNASIIFVPPQFAVDAIYEAVDNGIELIVVITEGIPIHDMVKVKNYIDKKGVKLIGPNCPGVITPNECKVGIMPGHIFKRGNIGIVSRSGTLTYEIVHQLTLNGFGQSTAIGIGGDPIIGMKFIDVLKLFKEDKETEAVVIIGEIGGTDEQDAAEYIKREFNKPVVAFIAGRTAPAEKRMGHAGAIIAGSEGTAEEKRKAFESANVKVANIPEEVPQLLKQIMK
ncbi:MAG: succinate--CoA ligase subunit alpha [candidate division WOR-3 bacterium]|jgi:succinyl-CoA synthetase alpha subunit